MNTHTRVLALSIAFICTGCASPISKMSGINGIGMGTHYDTAKQALLAQHFTITQDADMGTGYWRLQAEGPAANGNWGKLTGHSCQQVGFLFPNPNHVQPHRLKIDVFQQGPCAKDRKKQP